MTCSVQRGKVLKFITNVLPRCPNVSFLTTTRESFKFISHRVQFDSLRLQPFNVPSSQSLILRFLPSTTPVDSQEKVLRMCENAPLAIRLLCNLIKDSPREFLDDIRDVSGRLLDILDDSNVSDDATIKQLIQVTFDRLSTVEKEAFACLSVFDGV